jgi:hypothetical protein
MRPLKKLSEAWVYITYVDMCIGPPSAKTAFSEIVQELFKISIYLNLKNFSRDFFWEISWEHFMVATIIKNNDF